MVDTAPHAQTLMVQGTSSDAGKTLLVAGLCRVAARRGISVAPFKPQNMALNSAVTADGREIGRAQALQARAARIAPQVDHNPVLLKPNSDTGAQVIIHGRALANMDAQVFHDYKRVAMDAVLASHRRLVAEHALVVVEGAGSPAEINLRDRDIANMGFAEAVDCPVLLIADIDRGGVFAQLVGTLDLLSESEQARVVGFVINRFRGDKALLDPGLDWLAERTGKPVWGVLPYLQGLHLEAEDAIDARHAGATQSDAPQLRVAVPVLSRISNHTDFDVLRLHPQVALHFVGPGKRIEGADLIIVPGSKSVRRDLEMLRAQGWDEDILRHLRYGGRVLGICGGYQMLGNTVDDPHGVEGAPGRSAGLGLLELETVLEPEKQLAQVRGHLHGTPVAVRGYEIHCGRSQGPALDRPMLMLEGGPEGACSADDRVRGSYLHGLLDGPEACQALLGWAGLAGAQAVDLDAAQEASLDRVADACEAHLDAGLLGRFLPGA